MSVYIVMVTSANGDIFLNFLVNIACSLIFVIKGDLIKQKYSFFYHFISENFLVAVDVCCLFGFLSNR